jgi:hypothetical protein
MKAWMAASMGVLLGSAALAWAQADTVTVHRCVDGKGRVTLQDEACPPGSKGSTRRMQRPVDAPPRPPSEDRPREPEPEPLDYLPDYDRLPPPPMYRCTSYDGIVRHSESYDPNPRCEPLGLYAPPGRLTPELARTCRWVEDSCLRLSDEQACAVWRKKQAEARSKALHAFSDTEAYWKSELERTSQVIRESCS